MGKVVRWEVELDRARAEELARLQMASGCRTKKELFNNALTLFKWAIEKRTGGFRIQSVNEQTGEVKELDMPVLEYAARR